MISGRRPVRPDAQYYRQSRKRTPGGGRRGGGDAVSPVSAGLFLLCLAIGAAMIWWLR